jgi:hypothetical protein
VDTSSAPGTIDTRYPVGATVTVGIDASVPLLFAEVVFSLISAPSLMHSEKVTGLH